MIHIHKEINKKVYFASDLHLGAPNQEMSFKRELKFLKWLNEVKKDAAAIFILGDLFDFWFEYKNVVPKGFVRILGKLAEIRDEGTPVFFFVGNHDLWMRDYFEKELNIPTYHNPQEFKINNTTLLIGHGDGLGPGDYSYKKMKKIFTSPISKWLFRWLHPDIGIPLGQYFSVKNKLISGDEDVKYLGEDNEFLVQYCKEVLTTKHYDYFVFGHRHLPLNIELGQKSTYINIGDWVQYFTYGVMSKNTLEIEKFE